jgi:hypothetical protein
MVARLLASSRAFAPARKVQFALARRLPLLLCLLLAVTVLVAGCGGGAGGDTTGGSEVFTQAAGEIFLEPSGDAGPDSFGGEGFLIDRVVASPSALPAVTTLPTDPGAPVQIAALAGDALGLYGGSRSKVLANKDAQLQFLLDNLDKAKAFCAALNADPTLKWSGGDQVTPDQLAAYFAELTPLLLTRDIRVTNHGYRDGLPTPRQSVLQAGQLVLVDRYGVPRTRCECGNPLIPPIAVSVKPRYTGTPWPAFDPGLVIVIQPAPIFINIFTVIDIETGQTFGRPVGTSGGGDTESGTVTTMPPVTTSTEPVTTTTAGTIPSDAVGHGPYSGSATGWFGEGDPSGSNGGDGQAVGTVTYPEGVIGQAFGVDGSSYVEIPDSPDLTLGSGDFTIALWVYFDSVAERDPFIAHDESGGYSYAKWIFWYDASGHDQLQGQGALRFHVNLPNELTTDVIAAPWGPVPNTWLHVAVTRAAGTFRLYINGALVATQPSDIVIPDPAAPLTIGKAEAFLHAGRFDEVQLWHRALSDEEIFATFQAR